MEIRPEQPGDWPAAGRLYRKAFVGEYEAELIDELRAAGVAPIILVATENDALIGHILFADLGVQVDGRAVPALALAEMAVTAGLQRSGIGSRLVSAGLEAARRLHIEAVLVLGHPTYYPRFGFSAARARHLRTSFRGGDAFMALELKPDALSGQDGEVTYHPGFRLGPPL